MKKHYLESSNRGISYMKKVNGRLTGLVTFCVEAAFYEQVIERKIKGRIEATGRQGIRNRDLLDFRKERRG
jgi:hypothetical protein